MKIFFPLLINILLSVSTSKYAQYSSKRCGVTKQHHPSSIKNITKTDRTTTMIVKKIQSGEKATRNEQLRNKPRRYLL